MSGVLVALALVATASQCRWRSGHSAAVVGTADALLCRSVCAMQPPPQAALAVQWHVADGWAHGAAPALSGGYAPHQGP